MKRRKFLGNSLITAIGTLLVTANVSSHDVEKANIENLLVKHKLKYEEFAKNQSYSVEVVNIHIDYYKYGNRSLFSIGKEDLYPFSFEQGDYAVLLKPVSGGFVKTHIYELIGDEYQLIADNISLGKDSTMSWPAIGIEVNIINSL